MSHFNPDLSDKLYYSGVYCIFFFHLTKSSDPRAVLLFYLWLIPTFQPQNEDIIDHCSAAIPLLSPLLLLSPSNKSFLTAFSKKAAKLISPVSCCNSLLN